MHGGNEDIQANVIFICNYDPFGRNRYIYTFETVCREAPELSFGDDAYKIVVNTAGAEGEISDELREVILYLGSGGSSALMMGKSSFSQA